ncbi:DUF3566 domain-containing protein [Streptomyces sp. NPDC060194]|uniref:DUF3566 domain-containing protein n=1 Tax=Streptomyces sp. NPDC060194 TaxID=3347069 RepID=UPI00365F434C
MSGATGAGAKDESGAEDGRGSATDSRGGGNTVTDTRGPQTQETQGYKGPLPADRQQEAPKEPAQPYHPPQAYGPGAAPAGAKGSAAGGATAGGDPQRRPAAPRPGPQPPVPAPAQRTAPRTRKARLRVAKADPWSVMKVSFLLSIALGICTVVAAAVLWMVMDAMGVFSTVGGTISEATQSDDGGGFDLESFLSLPRVLTFTSIIAVIDVVLATALATLGAFIYNLSAGFVGGVELTLAEDE